jgi:hypothetical protein
MCIALVACGRGEPLDDASDAVIDSVDISEEESDVDIEEEPVVDIEEEPPAEPVEDVVYYDELPILEGYDFHEGYAWVVDKQLNSYLINTNGEAVYSTNSTSSYANDQFFLYPVENGIAWIMYMPDSNSVDNVSFSHNSTNNPAQ